jgi:hypothetical protein
MKFEVGKKYKTREGEIVEVFRIEPKEKFFPIKVCRTDGTFYTVTKDGKKMWNAESEEDLLFEINK